MNADFSMPILVVDDYQTMVRIMRNLLKQIGYENVDDASNGAAALEKVRAKRYSLIISDWNMEPMTGLELLQHVRAEAGSADTPFIMVTAEADQKQVFKALSNGATDYIVKPISPGTLEKKVRRLVNQIQGKAS